MPMSEEGVCLACKGQENQSGRSGQNKLGAIRCEVREVMRRGAGHGGSRI